MWFRKDGKGLVGGLPAEKINSISEKKRYSKVGAKIVIYSSEGARW